MAKRMPSVVSWLTTSEVVSYTGFGRSTIMKAVRAGQLPAIKVGSATTSHYRFILDDVDAWLRGDDAASAS